MATTSFALTLGEQRAQVDSRGGVLRRYQVGDVDVLAGAENLELFAFRGSLLAPWPNRVVGGRWTWQGVEHRLPVNDPATGAALHGLVYDVDWEVSQVDSCSIDLVHALAGRPGYPFPIALTVTYRLADDGLSCSLTAVNVGAEPAPVGLGVHPYVAAAAIVDDLMLTVPAETVLQTDGSWRETGRPRVEAADIDFRSPRRIGALVLDAAFTDVIPTGPGRSEAMIGRPDGRQVVLWSGPTCRWWVIYTGDTLPASEFRRSIAVEPMTCPPDAFNVGEIDVVQPGQSLRLDWGFALR